MFFFPKDPIACFIECLYFFVSISLISGLSLSIFFPIPSLWYYFHFFFLELLSMSLSYEISPFFMYAIFSFSFNSEQLIISFSVNVLYFPFSSELFIFHKFIYFLLGLLVFSFKFHSGHVRWRVLLQLLFYIY